MVKKSGHPLGVTGRMLLGAALTSVGMGLGSGVSAAEPQVDQADPVTRSAEESRPTPPMDVRTMTDQELGAELGRVHGKDSLRSQEVTTEMRARGMPMFEAAPPTSGFGISGGIPVRPGVSVTGTLAYDPQTGSWITSGGVRAGTPTGPRFTGITPRPDGFNASGNVKVDLGKHGEFSSTLSLNVSPDLEVSGSYKAKGTVTTPDGRSYETEVTVSRNADGTVDLSLPDGVSTSTPLPGGGTIGTTTPADPLEDAKPPEVTGPAPKTEEKPKEEKGWFDWFDLSGTLSFDKEFRPAPLPTPTQEEVEQALESWGEHQRQAAEEQNAWRAQNRPEAQYREALEIAEQKAAAAEQARRNALPDRDRDGLPDEEDATWNQNDTDPTSSDVGDGPEGGEGYPSDRVQNPAPTSPPESDDPNADYDHDGRPDDQDPTWNQNDTDPTSSDIGDGPESGTDYSGNTDSGGFRGDLSDADGDGLTGANDATPNQNDTDPTSTDIGDGPEGGEGYSGSTDASADSTSVGVGYSGGNPGSNTDGDADGDGLTGSADSTPNQNDTDPTSSDIGDGPEGGEGYSGSTDTGGSYAGTENDGGSGDSGADSTSDSVGYSSGSDSASDGYSGTDTESDTSSDTSSDTGTDTGGYSGSSTSDTGGYSGADADGDGLSGSADSTPNQNDTDPTSTDVGDGPEGGEGYSGSTDTGYGDSGTDPGTGDCTCF